MITSTGNVHRPGGPGALTENRENVRQQQLDFSRADFRERLIRGLPIDARLRELLLAIDRIADTSGIREGGLTIAEAKACELCQVLGCGERKLFYLLALVRRGCRYLDVESRSGRVSLFSMFWGPIVEDSRPVARLETPATVKLQPCKTPAIAPLQNCKIAPLQAPSVLDLSVTNDPSVIRREGVDALQPPRSICRGHESPDDLAIAELLLSLIRKRMPGIKAPKDLASWAKHVRLMREQDGRSAGEIRELLEWIFHDPASAGKGWPGWRAVILSTRKLREKFDAIQSQRLAARGGPDRLTQRRGLVEPSAYYSADDSEG
jgi:hypothetical protein